MNLKGFINKITVVENSVDMSTLEYHDFNPWPYIRLAILHKYSTIDIHKKKSSKNLQKKRNVSKFINLFKSWQRYIKNPIINEKIDIVFFTRVSESTDVVDGKRFNRYSDSLKYFFSKNYNIKTLEISDIESTSNRVVMDKYITSIDFILKIQQIKYKLYSRMNKVECFKNNTLENEIEQVFGFKVNVAQDIAYIDFLSLKFMKILKSYNPKLLFLTVFYRPEAMAMSLACHRLGIRVIEYQHGAQNDYHAMYTHWMNVPKNDYELIPDVFWMWGSVPKNRIERWSKNTSKHQAVIGGNLWLSFNKQRDVKILKLDKHYKKDKINILVSLQGDRFFSEFLLECIKNSSENIMWHFRDHPRLPLSDKLKKQITNFENVELNFSTETTLYELLKKTDIHITGYSTVAFEAQSFNVPTVFIHSNALNGYNSLINKNGLFYAKDSEELGILIEKLLKEDKKIKADYIISDLETHKATLAELMGAR